MQNNRLVGKRLWQKAAWSGIVAVSILAGSVHWAGQAEAKTADIGAIAGVCQDDSLGYRLEFQNKTNDQSLRVEVNPLEPSKLVPIDTYYVTHALDVRMTNRNGQVVSSLAKPMRMAINFNEIDFKRASKMDTSQSITRFSVGYWDSGAQKWRVLPTKIYWNGTTGVAEAETTLGTGQYALLWSYEDAPKLSDVPENHIRLMVDYATINPPAEPYIKEGRTMVPLRVIAENLNTKVNWNGPEGRIDLVKDLKTIKMWIGKPDVLKDGVPLQLKDASPSVVPEIVDGSTFVPLRTVVDALGAKVEWDASTRTVKILNN
ncbi:hypothetical protein GJ688_13060 [Heliobacillus mobilis]|uniref:Copper amine oxidase-like N-terminal domain-containing protein n=1 Tax=Heliobacterium mobile TaxID=28064 RepID=A0A6I3SLT0_HELMO|nr:copper amine oxidase N-terminal domain-containing protein [Heliobacterium mobile]MTV49903.1 hypothetical protein [Heliobacterium mobile]